jgi:hypothetical protein
MLALCCVILRVLAYLADSTVHVHVQLEETDSSCIDELQNVYVLLGQSFQVQCLCQWLSFLDVLGLRGYQVMFCVTIITKIL